MDSKTCYASDELSRQ